MAYTFRIHILGIPHTATTEQYSGCAFTQKVRKFLKMMSGRGHQIYHYGHTDTDWSYPDVEHVPVTDDNVLEQAYGLEYTQDQAWAQRGFAHYFKTDDAAYRHFHATTIKEIESRKQPHDILLLPFGWGHKAVADAHPDLIAIESGIGYADSFAEWRIFESHAVMNATYGRSAVAHCEQRWYWRVIPNSFDLADFDYSEDKQDYILYLGRIGRNKGVDIAIDAAQRAGRRLIIAGQGSLADVGYATTPGHVTLMGYATPDIRRQLMSQARALFIASTYLEPFAGVQVEAWLSGTPVISPDWAAFAELNVHGVTGYRCHTMQEFVSAIEQVGQLHPRHCRAHGEQFSLERVARQYEQYFQDVTDVYTGAGWYTVKETL